MSQPRATRIQLSSVIVTLSMLALMGIGLVAIGATEQAEGLSGFVAKQLIYSVMGGVAFVVCVAVPYRQFGKIAYSLFGFSLLLLLVLAAARFANHSSTFLPAVRGAHRWIDLVVFRAQPSELAKLSQIILLAWYLRLGNHYRKLTGLIPLFALTFVPMGLILIEPDLGTSLLFLPILYAMLYMAGARLKHLLGIVAIATVIVFIPVPRSTASMGPNEIAERKATAYWTYMSGDTQYIVSAAPLSVMQFHQLERIDGWLRQNDPKVIQGKGYHLHHSKIVLGSGKATGRGNWSTADIYFRMLPDDHTDFIFSIIGGHWGFVGCGAVIGLYFLIILFGVEIASVTYDPFGRLLAVGVIALMASQLFINIGMTMGLMPITGMTLPFISYGGSSLIVNCAALGLLVNVGQRRRQLLSRHAFEHKEDTTPVPYGPLK